MGQHDPRDVELGRRAIERGILDRARALAVLERATADRCGFIEAGRRLGVIDARAGQALSELAASLSSSPTSSPSSALSSSFASFGSPRPAEPGQAGLPRPGDVLGGYVLEKLLGRGGMGAVYAGRNEAGALRAIKVPLFEGEEAESFRARFEREARAMAKIPPHPNVLAIHAVGTDAGRAYCVLELVEGEGLDAAIKRGPIPLERGLEIAEQVGRALAHVHASGSSTAT